MSRRATAVLAGSVLLLLPASASARPGRTSLDVRLAVGADGVLDAQELLEVTGRGGSRLERRTLPEDGLLGAARVQGLRVSDPATGRAVARGAGRPPERARGCRGTAVWVRRDAGAVRVSWCHPAGDGAHRLRLGYRVRGAVFAHPEGQLAAYRVDGPDTGLRGLRVRLELPSSPRAVAAGPEVRPVVRGRVLSVRVGPASEPGSVEVGALLAPGTVDLGDAGQADEPARDVLARVRRGGPIAQVVTDGLTAVDGEDRVVARWALLLALAPLAVAGLLVVAALLLGRRRRRR